MATLTRNEAFQLLKEYTKTEHLITHALSVEGVMRHFATLENGDVETWGIVGLLHDLDYDQYPEQHCIKVQEILRERGVDAVSYTHLDVYKRQTVSRSEISSTKWVGIPLVSSIFIR